MSEAKDYLYAFKRPGLPEETIRAHRADVGNAGCLEFSNESGRTIIVYAPHAWEYVAPVVE